MNRCLCGLMCNLLCSAGLPVTSRPSVARQSVARSGTQAPGSGQPLPPVTQNGCENTEASDVPPQKPSLTGMF